MPCAFCQLEGSSPRRLAGLDVCTGCLSDPEPSLAEHGIAIEYTTFLRVFSASASADSMNRNVSFTCTPQLLHHRAIKMFVDEVEVGDPIFDDQVYVRTRAPEATKALLEVEGVQSAILSLMTGMTNNQLIGNHVTLSDGVLRMVGNPMGGITEDTLLDLRQAFAALAVHLS